MPAPWHFQNIAYRGTCRVLRNTMAQVALRRRDDRSKALGDTVAEFLGMDEPHQRVAAEVSGLSVHYDLGPSDIDKRHPLLGRRMPDLDIVTTDGTLRALHAVARSTAGVAQLR